MIVCFIVCVILLLLPLRRIEQGLVEYGSKDWFNYLRCFFAFMIIFHHMVKYAAVFGAPFVFFENIGYLSVAVFFMISGYGLSYKYRYGYVRGYALNKVVGIIIEYLIVMAMYALWEIISTGGIDIKQAIDELRNGILYVDNS